MIPRYQIVIFAVLLAASLAMSVALWQLRQRAHKRLLEVQNTAPTQAPAVTPVSPATLEVADDADSSITGQAFDLPLPQSPGARERAVLGKLLDLYAAPGALYPVPGGARSVSDVFLLPAAQAAVSAPGDAGLASPGSAPASTDELAVVNLTGAFAAGHPSGIEAETLTVLSICATLHANRPQIAKVRFLVDGKPRATLAGHLDLTRTYLPGESALAPSGGQP